MMKQFLKENIFFLHGAEKRADLQKEKLFYNTFTTKEYFVYSDREQTIPVRVFPVTDREYITYDAEFDEKYTHPNIVFIDPLYDYGEVSIRRNPIISYR